MRKLIKRTLVIAACNILLSQAFAQTTINKIDDKQVVCLKMVSNSPLPVSILAKRIAVATKSKTCNGKKFKFAAFKLTGKRPTILSKTQVSSDLFNALELKAYEENTGRKSSK